MELNTTEVSHSASLVGVEVFAEPESTICLRGRKSDTTQEKEVTSETAEASSSATAEPSISDSLSSMEPQMIKAFGPVSRTWFFQCDRARFVSFYFSGLLLGTLKASLKRPTDNQYPFFCLQRRWLLRHMDKSPLGRWPMVSGGRFSVSISRHEDGSASASSEDKAHPCPD